MSKIEKFKIFTKLSIFGLLYKEFLLLMRKKKGPALIIALPIVLSVIYGASVSALNSPVISNFKIGVCNFDKGNQTTQIISQLKSKFLIEDVSNEKECKEILITKVSRKEYLLGFIIPENFSAKLLSGEQAKIQYYIDNSEIGMAPLIDVLMKNALYEYSREIVSSAESEIRKQASQIHSDLNTFKTILSSIENIIKSNSILLGTAYSLLTPLLNELNSKIENYEEKIIFVENLNAAFLTQPIVLQSLGVYEQVNFQSFVFPLMFCIISLFTCLLLCSTNIIFDKKNNFILRLKTSGTSFITYLFSKIISFSLISLIPFIFIFILVLALGGTFSFDFQALMISFLLITSVNSLLGLLIGLISKSENVAILSSLIITLPAMFLSGAIVPIDILPNYIKIIAQVFPLHSEIILLKQTAIFNYSIEKAAPLVNTLFIYSLILFIAVYLLLKKLS